MHNTSECITISVGECGCNIGSKLWNNYINEPTKTVQKWIKRGPTKIDRSESIYENCNYHNSFFYKKENDKYIARNLSIDIDRNIINGIKTSRNNDLFDPQFLIDSNQDMDASNIFSRGYQSIGLSLYTDKIEDKLRKLVENCDNLSGFMINHSISGGTGSGLTALLLEQLSTEYKTKCKYTNSVMPVIGYPSISCVDPYNSILSMYRLIEHSSITSIFDNVQIYEICQKWQDIHVPSYNNINNLICQSISWSTWPLRPEYNIQTTDIEMTNLHSYQKLLVEFQRMHFVIHSMAPIWPDTLSRKYYCSGGSRPNYDIHRFIQSMISSQNFLVKIADFDAEEDVYMSMLMMFRGDVTMKIANVCWDWLKTNKKITMSEFIKLEDNLKIICKRMTAKEDDRHFWLRKRDVFMMANNTAIGRVFGERIRKKFDLLYSQKAYIHWYITEGLEENEFIEARETLKCLEVDYVDFTSEEDTEYFDEEDY